MKKILIIDDNKIIRDNTAEILELSGYKTLKAGSGKDGIRMAMNEKPDLVLCDIVMRGMDGYEVLYLLGANEDTANIPFIFLTGKTEKSDIRKGMLMGADDYITKPFEEMDLLEAIDRRLKKAERFKSEFSKNIHGLNRFLTSAKTFADLETLSVDKRPRAVRKGQMIYLEGDAADRVYFLNVGKIKIYKQNETGKEFITGMYQKGDFFGAIDLVEGLEYRETASAVENSEIVSIAKEELLTFIYSHRGVAMQFIHMLSNDINELKTSMLDAMYSSVRKRTANTLLLIQKKNHGEKTIGISRDDLAAMTGITSESMSRTLTSFKEEGFVDLKLKQVIILNEKKLLLMKN